MRRTSQINPSGISGCRFSTYVVYHKGKFLHEIYEILIKNVSEILTIKINTPVDHMGCTGVFIHY